VSNTRSIDGAEAAQEGHDQNADDPNAADTLGAYTCSCLLRWRKEAGAWSRHCIYGRMHIWANAQWRSGRNGEAPITRSGVDPIHACSMLRMPLCGSCSRGKGSPTRQKPYKKIICTRMSIGALLLLHGTAIRKTDRIERLTCSPADARMALCRVQPMSKKR
jgi:hypothetical protein